jgi:hypothetical protein
MNNKQPILEVDQFGNKWWWLNGKIHREDGPAYECISGRKYWCLNGKYYHFEEWFQALTQEQQYNYLWNLNE